MCCEYDGGGSDGGTDCNNAKCDGWITGPLGTISTTTPSFVVNKPGTTNCDPELCEFLIRIWKDSTETDPPVAIGGWHKINTADCRTAGTWTWTVPAGTLTERSYYWRGKAATDELQCDDTCDKGTFFVEINEQPEIEAFAITDPDSDSFPTTETIYQGSTVNFTGVYSDVDEPKGDLVENGNFENGVSYWNDYGSQVVWGVTTGSAAVGSRYLYMSRTGTIDAYVASDWIDYSSNLDGQPLTLSFSIKVSEAATIPEVSLQSYPTNGDWNNSRNLPLQNINPLPGGWQRFYLNTSFSGVNETRFRVILRPSYAIGQEVDYDAVLVESGSTLGMYTDLYNTQINFDDCADSASCTSSSTWPLGLRFSPREGFKIYAPGLGYSLLSAANVLPAYDTGSLRYYLANDVDLGNFATLVAGIDSTYAYMSGQYLEVHYTISFSNDFPEDSYRVNLVAEDLSNQYDTTSGGTYQVFSIGGAYYHPMGSLEILDSDVSVTGSIYDITQEYDGGAISCDVFDTPPPTVSGATVSFEGGSCPDPAVTMGDNGTFSTTLETDCTYQVSVTAPDYSLVNTELTGFATNCLQGVNPSFQVVSPVDGTINFGLSGINGQWLQAVGGDVLSFANIDVAVPDTCVIPACLPFIAIDDSLNSNGLVAAYGSISSGSGEVGDPYEWQIEDPGLERPASRGFNFYHALLDAQLAEGDDISGNVNLSDLNIIDSDFVVKMVNGNLTIDENVSVSQGNVLLVFVSGDITINEEVNNVEGIFIADGNIVINGAISTEQLTLEGVYVADAEGNGAGGLTNNRDLGLANNISPSVSFVYRPDMIVGLFGNNVSLSDSFTWEEGEP